MPRTPRYKHKIASLRSVVRDRTGHHHLNGVRGTARYVSLNARLLPQLIAALQGAKGKARERGMLSNQEQP